jgi:hypothetical protein
MEVLKARVPYDQIYWTFTLTVRTCDSDEVIKEGLPIVEHNYESMILHINEQLEEWLSVCQGAWDIRSSDYKHQTYVYFEREEDYVRYCFDWIK